MFEERLKSVYGSFDSIQRQFSERDVRTVHDKAAADTAIASAFSAAKDAVSVQNDTTKTAMAKTEASFTKEIDNIKELVSSLTAGTGPE